MPPGKKKLADGTDIDCDAIFDGLLAPAIRSAGLEPYRVDSDRRDGPTHPDMFQDLLPADLVLADLTTANRNVWYEIAIRHASRPGGLVIAYGLHDPLPFDIAGQHVQRYTLREGKLDPSAIEAECGALAEAIRAAGGATAP